MAKGSCVESQRVSSERHCFLGLKEVLRVLHAHLVWLRECCDWGHGLKICFRLPCPVWVTVCEFMTTPDLFLCWSLTVWAKLPPGQGVGKPGESVWRTSGGKLWGGMPLGPIFPEHKRKWHPGPSCVEALLGLPEELCMQQLIFLCRNKQSAYNYPQMISSQRLGCLLCMCMAVSIMGLKTGCLIFTLRAVMVKWGERWTGRKNMHWTL